MICLYYRFTKIEYQLKSIHMKISIKFTAREYNLLVSAHLLYSSLSEEDIRSNFEKISIENHLKPLNFRIKHCFNEGMKELRSWGEYVEFNPMTYSQMCMLKEQLEEILKYQTPIVIHELQKLVDVNTSIVWDG